MSDSKTQPKAIGSEDFKELVLGSDIFVDKSLLVKEVVEDSGKIILVTRPRRWGKSLNMDMIRRFLEIEVDIDGKILPFEKRLNPKLFLGGEVDLGLASGRRRTMRRLKIADYEDLITDYQGQFPVIFITFKSVEGKSYEDIENRVHLQIRKLFKEHNYLNKSDKLDSDEKESFETHLKGNIKRANLENSLSLLSDLLYKHFNKKVWVLIDEYDTPINSAYRNFGDKKEEFKEVLELFRGIMKSTFKKDTGQSDPPVEKGFITGILRIAKAELFSGLNNVREYSLLDKKFAKSYGFTQTEVDKLLKQVTITENPEKIKDWYNGYTFGGEVIYNPWSIMCCLENYGILDNYWIDSGGTNLIDKVLVSDELQEDLQGLVAGKSIISPIARQISFSDIEKPEGLFSLLLFSGYLNPDEIVDREDDIYKLSIPNKEVSNIYRKRLLEWVQHKLNISNKEYYFFITSLVDGKVDKFKEELQSMLLRSTSFHQTGEKKAELFYNGFMLGLTHSLPSSYMIDSDREAGEGRPDIVLIPRNKQIDKAIIIEYKVSQNKENLAFDAEQGLQQITDKNYDAKLKEYDHVKKIIKLGIAFCGKNVDIKHRIDEVGN